MDDELRVLAMRWTEVQADMMNVLNRRARSILDENKDVSLVAHAMGQSFIEHKNGQTYDPHELQVKNPEMPGLSAYVYALDVWEAMFGEQELGVWENRE